MGKKNILSHFLRRITLWILICPSHISQFSKLAWSSKSLSLRHCITVQEYHVMAFNEIKNTWNEEGASATSSNIIIFMSPWLKQRRQTSYKRRNSSWALENRSKQKVQLCARGNSMSEGKSVGKHEMCLRNGGKSGWKDYSHSKWLTLTNTEL